MEIFYIFKSIISKFTVMDYILSYLLMHAYDQYRVNFIYIIIII